MTRTLLLPFSFLLLVGAVHAQGIASKHHAPLNGTLLLNPTAAHHPAADGGHRGGGAPINDNCSSVSTVVLPLGGSIQFTGDNTNATEDGDYETGSGLEGAGPVVWHKFSIADCENVTLTYCATDPAFEYVFGILARTCPATDADWVTYASYDYTTCGNGNATVNFVAVPAGEYYLPVLLDPTSNAEGPYTIDVTASACPPPPANDDCANAIPLTSGASCEPTNFNTVAATGALPAVECNGSASPNAYDVWFSFVCANTEQTIGVAGYNAADAVIELFSGSCGSLTSIGCADETFPSAVDETSVEALDQTDLTVGDTYFVRVYDWNHSSAEHAFSICLTDGSGTSVGVTEHTQAAMLSVYPNPGNGNFNLHYTGVDGMGDIEVLDLAGRTVFSEHARFNSGNTRTLALGALAQGQYILRLTVNDVRVQQDLMVR